MSSISTTELASQAAGLLQDLNFSVADQDAVRALFLDSENLSETIAGLDDIIPGEELVKEFLIDLGVLRTLLEGDGDEFSFLDEEDSERIDSQLAERGTELLNVLIYLRDCRITGDEPDMESFLFEFLLVEEDDYQDEFFIYEDFLKFKDLEGADAETIMQAAKHIEDQEMKTIFIAFFSFLSSEFRFDGTFFGLKAGEDQLSEGAALYHLLCDFYNRDIPEEQEI